MELHGLQSHVFVKRLNTTQLHICILGLAVLNLTKVLAHMTLKFLSWYGIFWKKNVSSFLNCKSYSHFCSININVFEQKKNNNKTLATTANEFVIKLTMLWTTGTWSLKFRIEISTFPEKSWGLIITVFFSVFIIIFFFFFFFFLVFCCTCQVFGLFDQF